MAISDKEKTRGRVATLGGGPIFRKLGRIVVYDPVDLDAWVQSCLRPSLGSTSDAASN